VSSYAKTIMQDMRTVADEAQVVAAPRSKLTFTQSLPGSVAISRGATVGDIMFQQFDEGIIKSIGDVIAQATGAIADSTESTMRIAGVLGDAYDQAAAQQYAQSMRVTDLLGERLLATQQGQASVLPGMAKYVPETMKYLAIAAVVILVAWKVWK